ncbi:hypothetical protein EAY46_31065, partial [Vibrio anguillarum]|nr:hypothetical protein [Vibrio anguillarum]
RGVVCDKCNNYFARKVEKPFLSSPNTEALRFHQEIPNKRNKLPTITGELEGLSRPVSVNREDNNLIITLEDNEQYEAIVKGTTKQLYTLTSTNIPTSKDVSRFLAKMAVEALAKRLSGKLLETIIDDTQLDTIREHARLGKTDNWPCSIRRIYSANKAWGELPPELP